jgi:peptidoglycan/LPS O-acetylase OafA/YrhL
MHKESFPPYRPDIDGLRAFAVIAVVIYHAFPDKCRGGFIGVDMFFVISGYLISSIIVRDLQESKFSLLEFYFRRIRRIFPALILVLLACMGVGWKILFQDQMHVLESHIAASSIFASNFLLWGEAGYFNKASISKPLMHLWSLGIEEQFYLVWPVLLLLTYKLKRSFLFPVAILGGMSFLFNLINVQTDPDSAFYLPLPRFWELMTGSALALSGTKLGLLEKKFGNVFSVLGAFLFLIGLAVIHPQREFPGFWALLPVATSAFFIAAGSAGAVNRRILALPIFRKIGLISYPLYLWHWPLLSLAYMNKGRMPPDSTRVVLVALSFLLAWLTYQFVEKPVRNGSRGSIKAIALAGVMIVVGGGAALAYQFEIPEIPKSGLHYAPERNQGLISGYTNKFISEDLIRNNDLWGRREVSYDGKKFEKIKKSIGNRKQE